MSEGITLDFQSTSINRSLRQAHLACGRGARAGPGPSRAYSPDLPADGFGDPFQ